ncbi:MAG: Bug family tripartite tricarboxylate transporter substrate binding protein [Gemmatimonas sp.]
MSTTSRVSVLVAAACAVVPFAAFAQTGDFYKDKQLRVIIGTDAGGGYDLSGRLVARHIGRSIPGAPQIVIQNMPGADSLNAGNYIYNAAPQDGTIVGGLVQTLPQLQLFGDKNVKFDAAKFQWIGTPSSSVSVIAVWHTAPVKTLAEARATSIDLGASGQVGLDYNIPTMLNNILGTKFHVISGYKGGNQIELAMEQGEVMGRGGQNWAGWKVTRPDWIRDKKIRFLAQIGLEPAKDLPGVPSVMDLAQNDEQRDVLRLFSSTVSIGRPLVMGPGVPADRVKILRDAFRKTMSDPQFLAEAEKSGFEVSPITGEDLQKIVVGVVDTSPAVAEKARAAVSVR